ncbi:MAG: UDP-4-amino-4-deoxy-L-arabinose--oxoglutarate aminotransferase n1 [Verrucomicrobiota bacterium]|jgi:dTDP-4-amino-4,6-dideoxygalactose transaminase
MACTSNAQTVRVTEPAMPPLEEFVPYLERIWESKVLTNGGPFHTALEEALCEYLGVPYLCLFTNATIALVTALQALRISGEVITTPYSFVATAHSLLWNGIQPVFCDISERSLNLDPGKIEAAITPRTTAILPVHCYGHPCDVDGIQRVADGHGLKVIYDAAHAFGVRMPTGSVLKFGEVSVVSFHATKVFTTFEGGAVICSTPEMKRRLEQLRNFGIVSQVEVVAPGINGKMSEICAAFGLLQLQRMDSLLAARERIDGRYREGLRDVEGIRCLEECGQARSNYAYFPILVGGKYPLSRDALFERLAEHEIHARRYFYPLITEFPMYRNLPSAARSRLPVAFRAAEEVMCLPMYPDLPESVQDQVIEIVRGDL